MFSRTPLPPPESNGLKLELRLSEATLLKLLPLGITVLLGSSLWVYAQPPSSDSAAPAKVTETTRSVR